MKIVRLGQTESGLLFLVYLLKNYQMSQSERDQIQSNIMGLVNWLYTTSGYYDTSVQMKRNDYSAINDNFYQFINHLEIAIGQCQETHFFFHNHILKMFENCKDHFLAHHQVNNYMLLNGTLFTDRIAEVFAYMKDRKVLIVSSFDGLIRSQYESGNVYKIYETFPTLKSLLTYKFPYTFENQGPHQNYFETLQAVFDEIKQMDFDIAIMGCGCYGHMLTHKIDRELNKDAIYIGGSITNLFGILTARERRANTVKLNPYWITKIPEEYRPPNYERIEDGAYW